MVKNEFNLKTLIEFMIESLKELDSELRKNNSKLYVFQGEIIRN